MAELLIARGLPLDIFEASVSGNLERVRELMTANPALRDAHLPQGGAPLHLAAANGQVKVVEYLIYIAGQGGSSNKIDKILGVTPLYTAAHYKDVVIGEIMAERMLANGADPNAKQRDNRSALHAAAEAGNIGIARMLIRKGARVDLKDSDGKTPLDWAVEKQHVESAELLRHADAVPRDHSTSRGLYDARGQRLSGTEGVDLPQEWINEFVGVAHRDFERVKELLAKRPALLRANATWEESAVEASAHVGLKESVQFLLDKGASCSLCTAAMMGQADVVKRLLQEDPERIRERGPHDFPLLWYPIFGGGLTEIAESLLKQGADADVGAGGVAALHQAASAGQTKIVQLLLAHGADVNVKTRAGKTALSLAALNNDAKLVALLKQAGARE